MSHTAPSTTAVETERDMLIRSIEDTQRTYNVAFTLLKEKKSKEQILSARHTELSTVIEAAENDKKQHAAKMEALKLEAHRLNGLREIEVAKKRELMKEIAVVERTRVEDSRHFLHVSHDLNLRVREVDRIRTMLANYQKDYLNDLDFYKSCMPKFNGGRELRRIRMQEILNVLDQRIYFVQRKASVFAIEPEKIMKGAGKHTNAIQIATSTSDKFEEITEAKSEHTSLKISDEDETLSTEFVSKAKGSVVVEKAKVVSKKFPKPGIILPKAKQTFEFELNKKQEKGAAKQIEQIQENEIQVSKETKANAASIDDNELIADYDADFVGQDESAIQIQENFNSPTYETTAITSVYTSVAKSKKR